MTKPNIYENIIGWIGVVITLIAYSLNALGFISSIGFLYSSMNLLGWLGVGYIAFRFRNYQSTLINIIWSLVAIIALIRSLGFVI